MTYQDNGSTGRYSRWLLGGGALAAAILFVGLGLSASPVQAQVTRIYSGSIDAVGANCGGGTIDVTRSADGMVGWAGLKPAPPSAPLLAIDDPV